MKAGLPPGFLACKQDKTFAAAHCNFTLFMEYCKEIKTTQKFLASYYCIDTFIGKQHKKLSPKGTQVQELPETTTTFYLRFLATEVLVQSEFQLE